jgi:nanoRNase/pAp phosphatase (c-di-AMP/oligoRNAs hydrolase)
LSVDTDIATNLLMGVEEGSNSFAGADVSAETFTVVAELMKAGGKRSAPVSAQKSYPTATGARSLPSRLVQPAFTGTQSQQVSQDDKDKKEGEADKTPKDWLEPKIFKGTSIR